MSSDRQTGSGVGNRQEKSSREMSDFFPRKFGNVQYQYYDIKIFGCIPFRLYYSRHELLGLIL